MKDFAKSIRTNNTKVENSSKFDALDSIIQEASMYAQNAYRRLSSPYSATNIISDLSHCKQACDIGIKRAQEYDKELQDKERKGRTGNSKVGNDNWGRARDASNLYEDYRDAKRDGDTSYLTRAIQKAKDKVQLLEAKKRDIQEDLKDTEEAIKILKMIV